MFVKWKGKYKNGKIESLLHRQGYRDNCPMGKFDLKGLFLMHRCLACSFSVVPTFLHFFTRCDWNGAGKFEQYADVLKYFKILLLCLRETS